MKKNTDPRITTTQLKFSTYLNVVAILICICASYLLICLTMVDHGVDNLIIMLATVTYIAVVSALVVIGTALVCKYLLAKPIRYLSEAARKVAAGDFTVQLAPIRTDGQKDEFEVLIDDFNTMTAELASSEMLKNDFISTVSHEFKTPLSVIQNYATMLQSDGISEDERREYTEKISDAARRLTVLVTNILHLNRLEHQKIPVQKVRST